MKVGNTINGLTVTDVKRVNKLNLIQFLKEVNSYIQQGYQIDVNSARQVGLVLSVDLYKTGEPKKKETDVSKVSATETSEGTKNVTEVEVVKEEAAVAEKTPVAEEQSPLTAKKTTTRSKKTAQ